MEERRVHLIDGSYEYIFYTGFYKMTKVGVERTWNHVFLGDIYDIYRPDYSRCGRILLKPGEFYEFELMCVRKLKLNEFGHKKSYGKWKRYAVPLPKFETIR